MVRNVTSLTRSGLRDWLIQRVTAVILGAYAIFLVGFLMLHQPITFDLWSALFQNGFMRVFTFLALLSMVYHTWVGIWTVFTDYVKCSCLRLTLQIIVILALFSYLAWGVAIVWGL
jgi:succinate dehydrogenase / fumarate reductase membrane anchor subunit